MLRQRFISVIGRRAAFALVVAAAALLCLPFAAAVRAQDGSPGSLNSKPGATSQATSPLNPKGAIRVRTEEVTTPVTVRDSAGDMILDLTENDFHIYDDGVQQQIQHFGLGGEPLAIALVVETSSRIQPLLPAVRQTGIVFTETVMGRTSEAAVLGFDDSVKLLQKFTTDSDAVQKTINHLTLGDSGASLYDAMARGVSLLAEQPPARRRILLVMSEAVDNGSETKLGEVLRAAQRANVTIYSIGLSTTAAELRAAPSYQGPAPIGPPGTFPVPVPPGQPQVPSAEAQTQESSANLLAVVMWLLRTGRNAVGANALQVASKATGGLNTSPKKDASIQTAMDTIGGELHAQYTLAYRPSAVERSGYHTIRVTVDRPGLTVRTRPGYYVASPTK